MMNYLTCVRDGAAGMAAVCCVGVGGVGHVRVSLGCLWVASSWLVDGGRGRPLRRRVWGVAFTHFPCRLRGRCWVRATEFPAVARMRPPAYWSAGAAWPGRFWTRWWTVNRCLFGFKFSRFVLLTEFLLWLQTFRLVIVLSLSLLQTFWAHGFLQLAVSTE